MFQFISGCTAHWNTPHPPVAQWEQIILREAKVNRSRKEKRSHDITHVENKKMFWFIFFIQVETVGDKYMTVSGLPEPCTHHAKSICHLALDMMEIAGQVKVDDEPVQVWDESQVSE